VPGVEASEAVVEAAAAVAPAPGLAASARGVPVEDEQDGGGESTTSRTGGARVGDELGRAGEEQRRSRTGGIWPRAGLAARESLLILPRLCLVAARGPPRRLAPRCSTMPLVAATGFAQRLGARSRRVVAA